MKWRTMKFSSPLFVYLHYLISFWTPFFRLSATCTHCIAIRFVVELMDEREMVDWAESRPLHCLHGQQRANWWNESIFSFLIQQNTNRIKTWDFVGQRTCWSILKNRMNERGRLKSGSQLSMASSVFVVTVESQCAIICEIIDRCARARSKRT